MKKFFEILGFPFVKLFNTVKNLSVKGKIILVSSVVVLAALVTGGLILLNNYKNRPVTVTFDTRFGTSVADVTLKRGEAYIPAENAPVPERTGMIFTGWYIDKNAKTLYNGEPIKKNTTLYAGWEETGFSVAKDLGSLPKDTAFTIFSTEKISSGMISDYVCLTALNGPENAVTATELTNKSSTGYYYKLTFEKPFADDGIYRLQFTKPSKAWLTDFNGVAYTDRVSDDFTFTVVHPENETLVPVTATAQSSEYNDAILAAIVNAALRSYNTTLVKYGVTHEDNSLSSIDGVATAASFGIGPEEFVSANKSSSSGWTFEKTGLDPVFTAEIADGKGIVGFSLVNGKLSFKKTDNPTVYAIQIKLDASETYSLSDLVELKNESFDSMASDFYRTELIADSKLNLDITFTIENHGPNNETITLEPESLSTTIEECLSEILGSKSGGFSDDDFILARTEVAFGTDADVLSVDFVLSVNGASALSTAIGSDCSSAFFVTNGMRTFNSDSGLENIETFERPVYGKRILRQSADFGGIAESMLVTSSNATFTASSLTLDCTTGISGHCTLTQKAAFIEKQSGNTFNIADFAQSLCKPAKSDNESDKTATYLNFGDVTIHLFSRFLDLTAPDSGNGTRYQLVENQTPAPEDASDSSDTPAVPAESATLGILANPADVKISVKVVDIPYYTVGAGQFEQSDKESASLISISNGKVSINPACNRAVFDLVIRPKDSKIKDDSDDYSDARVIRVNYEMLQEYKPCKVSVYDTEGVELFSGSFRSGDTISPNFSSPNSKAQFLIFAQYNTNYYQPSTLGFYNAPMGTDGNKYTCLISLSKDLNLYLTLKTNFTEVNWYCRYGSEIDKNVKEKTRFIYEGASTEIKHPSVSEITIIPGEYDETQIKFISFSDNYTIVDGKYKRYTNTGYIDLSRTSISYQAHIFIKYPDIDEPVEYAVLPGKYDTDFVFPPEFLEQLSKTCEVIGFCNGNTIPDGVTPDTYDAWASERNVFASPERDVAEVSYCALVRYTPGKIENLLTGLDGSVVQRKTVFESAQISTEKLQEELEKIPSAEYTLYWNSEKSAYEVYHFSGYLDPESTIENDGYTKSTAILGIYTYFGQTDIATVDFKSNCDLKIYSRDLAENPESQVIREMTDDYTYHIIGSTGNIHGSSIRPSDVNFVAPELGIPEDYKDILTYYWVDDNHPEIKLTPDTMYSMNIIPVDGLVLHPVFDDVRIVELTVSDGTISETVYVFDQKGNRMTEESVIAAASAINPALSELAEDSAFPLYYYGCRDTFDSPVIIDHLEIAFKHKLSQVFLHTGDGGPFEDNTILQIIEGEPDTPIKESAAKRIKESSTTSTNPAYIRGYTFLGFAETLDGEPRPLSTYTYSNQDLYAIYSRYTKWGVTFISGAGTFRDGTTSQTVFVLEGSLPEVPEAPSVSGKTFTGWTDKSGQRLDPSRLEISFATTYYASYDYNTFKLELKVSNLTCTYDGKVHTPEIKVSGLPSGYTCSFSTDYSSKDVTNGKKTVGYKNLTVYDKDGNDVTSRARVTVIYGSLEIKPATLVVTTDSISASYLNEYSNIIGTGHYSGLIADETVDFRVTGFINFYNTENPALAEWQRSFFADHGYVESSNTWQINWNNSTAKQGNYTIEEHIGTLRLVKRSIATFKCNNAFLLKTGDAGEVKSILAAAAENGTLSETFTCTYELDANTKLTSFVFPYIWKYDPYFESDDTTFNTKYLKPITSGDIRSITVKRTSDGSTLGEYGLDAIWSFVLDDSYTFQINLNN